MQHLSTPLARALGAAALVSTAAAWGAATFRSDTGRRLDIVVLLALAALFALGWLLASRSAPLVKPLPATAPARTAIPGKLGAVRRDWGLIAAAYLTVWAPNVAACAANEGRESLLGDLFVVLTFVLGAALSLCNLSLLQSYLDPAQRMLREDAAAGGVHAVRVRFGTPVRETYRYPTGTGVGRIGVRSSYHIELVPEGETDGRGTVRLRATHAGHSVIVSEKHLTHAAAQLVGHGGWLCWPTRWRDIAGTEKERKVAAAFVSDSGHVVWGVTQEEDYAPYLRQGAAPVCATDTALTVTPLPRPSRYFPKVHGRHLGVAAVGALLALPFLLDVVPYWASLLLGVFSGALGIFAGMTLDGVGVDQEPWSVRERLHPALQ
ncbi:hypothetical protein [Streptomyces cinerochromogenes]|uniref:hypothetical protein n=1 Tax=Streptomyces cinerochromogenes TaxID=66422 RepID=UPI001670C0C3|nr:hypothetical protein [Streptomyces cinerochromogenes]GGS80698.1 hypothetical protein GCM10010206_49120 [Streptomyces cinerochromogenes]